ncbi:MAG: AraC family transcriptional regulator [Gemmatimonadota bacterium]
MSAQPSWNCGHIAGRSTSLFDVDLYRLDEGFSGPVHQHGRPGIAWGVTGAMQVVGAGRTDDIFAAAPLFIPADYPHRERVPFGLAVCVLARPRGPAFPGGFESRVGALPAGAALRTGRRLLRELTEGDDVSDLAVDAALLEALAVLARHEAPRARNGSRLAPWLERVRDRLHDDFRDPPAAARLAADAGVSASHLSRAFRDAFGCSIPRYLRDLRVRRAALLLAETPDPVSAVALDAGFYDQSHLTRSFRAALGVTPSAYRRMSRD